MSIYGRSIRATVDQSKNNVENDLPDCQDILTNFILRPINVSYAQNEMCIFQHYIKMDFHSMGIEVLSLYCKVLMRTQTEVSFSPCHGWCLSPSTTFENRLNINKIWSRFL